VVESVGEVADGIRRALKLMPAERLWIQPDCGLKIRTLEEAEAKLRVIMEAVRQVRREQGIG